MPTIIDELIVAIAFRGDTRELERVQERVKNFRRNMDSLAKGAGILGASLSGLGAAAARPILDFERSMNRLQAVSGSTVDEMVELRRQARELGATLPVSASQAADAQYELALAGFSVQEIMESVPHVLDLAIAGELELGEAANLVAAQLRAFQLDISETQRVVDVLAETASASATTVAELGPSFVQISALAGSLGVSIEDTAAAIGILRSNGLRAEQAGTALRNIIIRLIAPTSEAASALNNLGQDTEGLGEARATIEALGISADTLARQITSGDILGAFQSLEQAQISAAEAARIFGAEGVTGANIFAAQSNAVKVLSERLNTAEGRASEMRDIIAQGLPGAFDAAKSSIEELALSLGESGLTRVLAKAAAIIRFVSLRTAELPGPIKAIAVAALAAGPVLLGLAAAAKIVSFALGGFTVIVRAANGVVWLWRNALLATRIQMFLLAVQTKLSTIATWLNTTATTANTGTLWGRIAALLASRAAILAGVVATGAATAAQWALNTAMYANPIGLIIAAVIALAAGLFFLVKKVDVVRNAFVVAFNWVKDNWPLLLAIITGPVGLAVYAFVKFKDDIIGVFASVKDFIIGVWQSIWDFILGIINRIKNAPAELLESLPGGKFVQKALVALPGFAAGGVVPGPVGRAQAAIVHGGEMVLPQPFADNMQRLLEGGVSALAGPAPGMATAGAGAGVPGGGYTDNRDMSITISEGAVVVHAAPGQDAAEIGEVVSQKLRAEIRAAYRAFDSGIHR